jgi:hypothetical protein
LSQTSVPGGGSLIELGGSQASPYILVGAGANSITVTGGAGTAALSCGQFATTPGGVCTVTTDATGVFNVGSTISNNGIVGAWCTIGGDFATINGSGNVVPYSSYTSISNGTFTATSSSNLKSTASGTYGLSSSTPTYSAGFSCL